MEKKLKYLRNQYGDELKKIRGVKSGMIFAAHEEQEEEDGRQQAEFAQFFWRSSDKVTNNKTRCYIKGISYS